MTDGTAAFAEDYWHHQHDDATTTPGAADAATPSHPFHHQQQEPGSPPGLVQQTIHRMMHEDGNGACAHPVHGHSFQSLPSSRPSSLLLLLPWNRRGANQTRSCVACDKDTDWSSTDAVVQCVTCGVVAHRACAMLVSSSSDAPTAPGSSQHISWQGRECETTEMGQKEEEETIRFEQEDTLASVTTVNHENDKHNNTVVPPIANKPAASSPLQNINNNNDDNTMSNSLWDNENDNLTSSTTSPRGRRPGRIKKPRPCIVSTTQEDPVSVPSSFASVAKALQENVLQSFNHPLRNKNTAKPMRQPKQRRATASFPGQRQTSATTLVHPKEVQAEKRNHRTDRKSVVVRRRNHDKQNDDNNDGDDESSSSSSSSSNDPLRLAWNSVKSKVNVGVVAGALAGGAAGLALAGPAGAYGA